MKELEPRLVESGYISGKVMADSYAQYPDPVYWTSVITFVAAWGSKAR